MRKLIYFNEQKSNFVKLGLSIVTFFTLFITGLQIYFIITEDIAFDFSIYTLPLILLIFIFIGNLVNKKFNDPIIEININRRMELINYGIKCEGKILEIVQSREYNSTRKIWEDVFSLKVQFFSTVFNEYVIQTTPYIKNISENDIIGTSRKCIIFEKADATIRDTSNLYTGTSNEIDLLQFFSTKNMINGLKVETTKDYAFIVDEADIITN